MRKIATVKIVKKNNSLIPGCSYSLVVDEVEEDEGETINGNVFFILLNIDRNA